MTRMFARPVNILNIYQFLWNFANQHSRVIHIEQHTEPVPLLLAFCVIWCINTGNIFCMETFLSTGKSKIRIAHLYPISVDKIFNCHKFDKKWKNQALTTHMPIFAIIRDQIRKWRHFLYHYLFAQNLWKSYRKTSIFDVILESIICLRLYFAEICLYIRKL